MATAFQAGFGPIWPISVAAYHEMIDKGILKSDDPVELLEGVIVQKMGKNPPHRIATRATRLALERSIPPGWYVDTQEPITTDSSEPEPDVAVLRGDSRDYPDRHPGPDDAGIIVEIADATLDRDRILKKRIYARAGIPSHWILDLKQRRLETYSNPVHDDYRVCAVYGPGESVELTLDGVTAGRIAVADLLP